MACRHHVSELWGEAACKVIYGPTESRNENCFVTSAAAWNSIKTKDYKLPVPVDLEDYLWDFILKS